MKFLLHYDEVATVSKEQRREKPCAGQGGGCGEAAWVPPW